MSTEEADPVSRVGARTRAQISATLLVGVARDFLRELLHGHGVEPVEEGEIAALCEKCEEVRRHAWRSKACNSVLFYATLLIVLVGTLWPALDRHLLSLDSELVSGLLQSAVFIVGGSVLAVYRRHKIRQTELEHALRGALFTALPIADRIRRLEWVLQPQEDETKNRKSARRRRQRRGWNFGDRDELRQRIAADGDSAYTEEQLLVLATQLKDASIKAWAYDLVHKWMRGLAIGSIIVGLTLPLLARWISGRRDLPSLGTIQSILVVGLGALFWGVGRQYLSKRTRLELARDRVFDTPEAFAPKSRRLPDALHEIDTGMSRGSDES